MNSIFSLQKSISKSIFAGYTGIKNSVQNGLKIVKLDFSKLIFQKSSTDQQGEGRKLLKGGNNLRKYGICTLNLGFLNKVCIFKLQIQGLVAWSTV